MLFAIQQSLDIYFLWSDLRLPQNTRKITPTDNLSGLIYLRPSGENSVVPLYTNLDLVTNWRIMVDFQTLNCHYSFGIQPMWNKFCVALVWVTYFGYIRNCTPVALLQRCDKTKNWPIPTSDLHLVLAPEHCLSYDLLFLHPNKKLQDFRLNSSTQIEDFVTFRPSRL